MTVDDAHSLVKAALRGENGEGYDGLQDLRLADLNDSETEYAWKALNALYRLDMALAERSCLDEIERPHE